MPCNKYDQLETSDIYQTVLVIHNTSDKLKVTKQQANVAHLKYCRCDDDSSPKQKHSSSWIIGAPVRCHEVALPLCNGFFQFANVLKMESNSHISACWETCSIIICIGYWEVSPIEFSGIYSQESVKGIAASGCNPMYTFLGANLTEQYGSN